MKEDERIFKKEKPHICGAFQTFSGKTYFTRSM